MSYETDVHTIRTTPCKLDSSSMETAVQFLDCLPLPGQMATDCV